MNVLTENQYNEGISKYKLLSATAGVGSIVTTKLGYYILISDINKWPFITNVQKEIVKIKEDSKEKETEWYGMAKRRAKSLGISLIDDPRFVEFLKQEKGLKDLLCLVAIPHLSMNDHFNTVNVKNNPTLQELKNKGEDPKVEDFMVPGTHFPKWFRNRKGELKSYQEWFLNWRKGGNKQKYFAPPRDINDPKKDAYGKIVTRKFKDIDEIEETVNLYHELTQTNLILICPNGHLSDIPWPSFLRWKTEKTMNKRAKTDTGIDLFTLEPCCTSPDLKWTESTTRSEGYASIYLECKNPDCQLGSGKDKEHPKVNLEGINNLSPKCKCEKPWEIDLTFANHILPCDNECIDALTKAQQMQVSLVTGNSIYFANGFSSLYAPVHLVEGISEELGMALSEYQNKYKRFLEFEPEASKEQFAAQQITEEKIRKAGVSEELIKKGFIDDLKGLFTKEKAQRTEDTYEHYRYEEYKCFSNYENVDLQGLTFKDILLPNDLLPYFKKIQQVQELKVSQVQLDFTRLKPSERIKKDNDIISTVEGQDIFSVQSSELFVLPANETFGEGLFFEFDNQIIDQWFQHNIAILTPRLAALTKEPKKGQADMATSIRQRIAQNGIKHILIHTFSHILMRELEFSCGYPTASLKERLYISPRMSGVLIYTVEGSEGSMGGLVWQGQPSKVMELMKKAMERAFDCSSDPLCWESDGQGIFDLNLAACFSCGLVSETACEERNLILDRRVLIDPAFGFFKDLK